MTYSSRNFLISTGIGSVERVPRSNLLSSAMMSLQTSTHSSQMKTVGPAMSFRTSFWSLLQNEHRRTSASPPFFTIGTSYPAMPGDSRPFPDDIVNNTVFLTLVRRHDVVPLGVVLNTLDRLSGMVDQDVIDALAHSQNFAGCNINIGRLAGQTRH